MARTDQLGKTATVVFDSEGDKCVQYHATVVVRFNAERIVLNTGGYETATTKLRMNQASNQFGLGYIVYQESFQWFVEFKGETHRFEGNTVTLER